MARHQCKHLLGIIMEWLPTSDIEDMMAQSKRRAERHELWMAWHQRRLDRYSEGNFAPAPDDPEPLKPEISFPADVAAALNI